MHDAERWLIEDLQSQLEAAVEAREDGDYEDSGRALEALLARFPRHVGITIEYVRTLSRLGAYQQADALLADAVANAPDDPVLAKVWAELPTQINDFSEVIRRGAHLRAKFAEVDQSPEWSTLTTEFDALYESGRWDCLSRSLDENWDVVSRNATVLPAGLVATGKLFQPLRMRLLAEAAVPEAWRNLRPDAARNLLIQTRVALANQRIAQLAGYRVVSLGQNCLPYQLFGRWGLVAPRATTEALTPFDLGGFTGDKAAEAIATDFAAFANHDDYVVSSAWGGGQMLTHRPTGVGFFHERGPYWLDDRPKFFARIGSMIRSWRALRNGGGNIYVFCLCGAGSVERLVEVVRRTLLRPQDYLLVLDVLREPHEVPTDDQVFYVHAPYPPDYDWTDFGHQISSRGLAFELGAARPVVRLLRRLLPQDIVASAATAALRRAVDLCLEEVRAPDASEIADALRSLSYGHDGSEMSGQEATPASVPAGETDEDRHDAIAAAAQDMPLLQAWLERPGRSADWQGALARSRALQTTGAQVAATGIALGIRVELKATYELGLWNEIVPLIESYRGDILGSPALFADAVDVLGRLSGRRCLEQLLASAPPDIAHALPEAGLDNLRWQVAAASANADVLAQSDSRLIALGQDAKSHLFGLRWGLQDAAARPDRLTPFDTAGFAANTISEIIESRFAGFLDRSAYDIVPAWFGGLMPIHRRTGAFFFAQRRANWSGTDMGRFLEDVERMIENWREALQHPRKSFFICLRESCRADEILQALRRDGHESQLLVLDLAGQALDAPAPAGMTFLDAPPPADYQGDGLLPCAAGDVLAFESNVAGQILRHLAP